MGLGDKVGGEGDDAERDEDFPFIIYFSYRVFLLFNRFY